MKTSHKINEPIFFKKKVASKLSLPTDVRSIAAQRALERRHRDSDYAKTESTEAEQE
jgi:hypothetical protein